MPTYPELEPTSHPALEPTSPLKPLKPQFTAEPLKLVVLSHGIDGCPADMDEVRTQLHAVDPEVEVFDSPVNKGRKTSAGIELCAERLWIELRARLERETRAVALSLVGHSLGGLILRAVAVRLVAWERARPEGAAPRLSFEHYVGVAAPHLGVRHLGQGGHKGFGWLMHKSAGVMRAGLRTIKGRTGPDLLLSNQTLDALSGEAGCEALARFRRRVTVGNVVGDWVTPWASTSLLDAHEASLVERSFEPDGASVLWTAEEVQRLRKCGLAPTMRLEPDVARPDGVPCLVVGPLPADWAPSSTEAAHRTWEDGLFSRLVGGGAAAPKARLAASLLRRLRSCGEWEVHPVRFATHFGSPISPSFLGGVLSPHVDVMGIPKQRKTDAGVEVVRHLAAGLARVEKV